jgi:hypothetical protein
MGNGVFSLHTLQYNGVSDITLHIFYLWYKWRSVLSDFMEVYVSCGGSGRIADSGEPIRDENGSITGWGPPAKCPGCENCQPPEPVIPTPRQP